MAGSSARGSPLSGSGRDGVLDRRREARQRCRVVEILHDQLDGAIEARVARFRRDLRLAGAGDEEEKHRRRKGLAQSQHVRVNLAVRDRPPSFCRGKARFFVARRRRAAHGVRRGSRDRDGRLSSPVVIGCRAGRIGHEMISVARSLAVAALAAAVFSAGGLDGRREEHAARGLRPSPPRGSDHSPGDPIRRQRQFYRQATARLWERRMHTAPRRRRGVAGRTGRSGAAAPRAEGLRLLSADAGPWPRWQNGPTLAAPQQRRSDTSPDWTRPSSILSATSPGSPRIRPASPST